MAVAELLLGWSHATANVSFLACWQNLPTAALSPVCTKDSRRDSVAGKVVAELNGPFQLNTSWLTAL